jgi:hypothetical protein
MIYSEHHRAFFADGEHLDFYTEQSVRLNPDCYLKALIYTFGICPDTRRRFDSLYNSKNKSIVPETLNAGWQTGGSLKVARLAFQLFTDGTPSAFLDPGNPDVAECMRYSVSDIFCCCYAPFFVEAIKLRYPDYMKLSVSPGLFFSPITPPNPISYHAAPHSA